MSKTQVQQFFGANAEKYASSKVHAKGASLARLVALVQPQADWQVLDVATAAGHTAFVFAPHVAHVVATDLTPEMLVVAAKVGQEKGIDNVSFQEADAEALPFEDARFDLVTCRIAPHHFPHIDRFVAESARTLRPGGILAVVDNVSPADQAASDYYNTFEKLRDPSHGRCLTLAEWLAAFAAGGFQVQAHETAFKEMEFNSWADRMNVDAQTKDTLRKLLHGGPQTVVDFWTPVDEGDDSKFYLTEAIIIGKKIE